MRLRCLRRSTAVFIVAVVAGCSNAGRLLPGEAPRVWIGSEPTAVMMVEMARTGTTLSGTLDLTSLVSPDSTTAKVRHAAFTGTVDGEAMTLTFPQGLGFSTSLSGALTASSLSLQFPKDNGTIAAAELHPGSVDEYNELVAAVNDKASTNTATEQVADRIATENELGVQQAAARRAAGIAKQNRTRSRAEAAAQALADDVDRLQEAVNTDPDFDSFEDHLATARDHLAMAGTTATKAATDGLQACSDAVSARSARASVLTDSYNINNDLTALKRNIDSVHSALAAVNDNVGTTQEIDDLTATANSTTTAWNKRGRAYQVTMAQLLAQATDIADQAVEHYC